jgi:hypothetical protein
MARTSAFVLLLSAFAVAGLAQTATGDVAAQQPAAAPAPAAKSPYVWGHVTFTATLDGYFSHGFNDPPDGVNLLRNFDSREGQPTLNMGKFSLDMPAAPVGFHLEAGGGKAFDLIEASAPHGGQDGWKQIMQAYVSFKPKSWKGVQVDVGKFFTSAGAEGTDTLANFNYSRSLLYALGPYYHTGLRVTFPVTKTLTGGVQVVEGWNGFDGKNHGVTLGLTSTYAPNSKVSWANNYYTGPEDYYGIRTYRNFFDTALTVNANAKTSVYFNFDYGHDSLPAGAGSASYYGPAVAARYQIAKKLAVSARGEIYKDADGFWTGAERRLSEFTLTGEYKHNNYFLTRVEYRRDSSDSPYFSKATGQLVGGQPTFLVGMVVFFGPPR